MPLKVHFYQITFSDHCDSFLSLLDPDIKISEGNTIPEHADYDVLVNSKPTRDWIEASPNLRAIVTPWAGITEEARRILPDYPQITLHNLHHNNYNTAEFGLALLLAAAKNIIPLDQDLRNNDWTGRYEKSSAILLRGRTALILGYGEIGQAIGDYCLALGMKVITTRRNPEDSPHSGSVEIYSGDDLHQLLPRAEVLIVALPLTDETKDLIGEDEINLMPKGSLLINIGRGLIVNQQALFNALVEGHLRGAGSDVWYHYPKSTADRKNTPPADLPFGELDNLVLSPHRGGMVEEEEPQRISALANLLNAANRGEPIPNKVDLQAGY